MKAVNQSVGRAIRHKADYASILFLDHRCLISIPNLNYYNQIQLWAIRASNKAAN